MKSIKCMCLNKKEIESVSSAIGYVSNLLENCPADEETEDGKRVIDDLNETIEGLNSIINKNKNQKIRRMVIKLLKQK